MVEKFMVEKLMFEMSGVEKSRIDKSGFEKSRVKCPATFEIHLSCCFIRFINWIRIVVKFCQLFFFLQVSTSDNLSAKFGIAILSNQIEIFTDQTISCLKKSLLKFEVAQGFSENLKLEDIPKSSLNTI